jgi:DNA polymerase III alpha subunit
MAALQERFRRGAAERGVRRGAIVEIWNLIQNFAGYSYCKAHAVTYGAISYQAAYLKAHYPAEFLCAVMANQGGFYETREYLEEARRWGVRILPPDVNRSGVEHRTETGECEQSQCELRVMNDEVDEVLHQSSLITRTSVAIRIGLAQVKGISQRALNSILHARSQRPFASLRDFYFRTQVNDSETERLILCGALGSLGPTRPQLLWELRLLSKDIRKSFANTLGADLFDPAAEEEADCEWRIEHSALRTPWPEQSRRPHSALCTPWPEQSRRPHSALRTLHSALCTPHSALRTLHSSVPPLPEYPIAERIRLEQEILGLSVSDHPLRMFSRELAERDLALKQSEPLHASGLARSDQLPGKVGRSVTVAGWLVTMRRAVTRDRQYMKFLTLEDRFGTMEVILFPQAYRRFGHLLRSYGPYLVRGRVEQNHRAIGITADWLDLLN